MKKNKHLGSDFDDFLKEEKIFGNAESVAVKRVLAHQIEEEMKKLHINKQAMARKMETSRSALDRLLDPVNTSVTLGTMVKAAAVMDKRIEIRVSD